MGNDINDYSIKPAGYTFLSQPGLPHPRYHPIVFGRTVTKLGQLATRADMRFKQLLSMDIPHPQTDAILNGLKQKVPHLSDHLQGSFHAHQTPADVQNKPESELGNTMLEKVEKLKRVLERSNEVLASATTVFPMTLFRDKIIVDRTKITITKKSFFQTDEVMSIRIEDILNVKASYGPFFGSITVAVRVLSSEDHHSINWLWRDDAIDLKHIIQGYIIAHHNKIDCRDQDRGELIKTLTELGHDSNGGYPAA